MHSDRPAQPSPLTPEPLARILHEHRVAMAEELGLSDPESLPLLLLPANRTRPSRLPQRRKERFRQHLQRIVDKAFALLSASPSNSQTASPSSQNLDESPLLEKACATCRGRCCHAGGEHAFIDEVTVSRYRQAHPDAGPADFIDSYMSYLGEHSYERSCVFHGEGGCHLPRSMRADICNGFLCTPLSDLREKDGSTPILSAAVHGERVIRLSVIE